MTLTLKTFGRYLMQYGTGRLNSSIDKQKYSLFCRQFQSFSNNEHELANFQISWKNPNESKMHVLNYAYRGQDTSFYLSQVQKTCQLSHKSPAFRVRSEAVKMVARVAQEGLLKILPGPCPDT